MGDEVSECVCATNTASSILATVRAHNANWQWESSKVMSIVIVGKVHNNGKIPASQTQRREEKVQTQT